jgi:Phosphotransferase enzyme family
MPSEEILQQGPHRKVVRVGDTVRRPVQPWTPAVHALLRHLEAVGFPYAPRLLGIDGEGREVLSYIPGDSGPQAWAKVTHDRGLDAFAGLLRDYHDAVSGFAPAAELMWAVGGGVPGDGEVVCHGAFGPWNTVWQGDRPMGIVDWDLARPAPRLHDVAYALEYVAPFRNDAECLRWLRFATPPDRRRRIERFCAAYGLPSADGIVDAVISIQREGADFVRRLAAQGREPQATWVAEGYLQELARRVAWSTANRHLFE